MSGFIYVWFDTHNKMYYIGSHYGAEDDGYICSSPWMLRAYKNRPHHFRRRIVEHVSGSRELLLERENHWLSQIKESEISPQSYTPRYYNLLTKTWNYWHTKSDSRLTVSQKISEATKGIPKPKSEAHRKAMSKSQKGKTHVGRKLTEEHKKAISDGNMGKKMVDRGPEWRAKISTTKKAQAKSPHNKGIPQSEEAKAKFRETLRLKKLALNTAKMEI